MLLVKIKPGIAHIGKDQQPRSHQSKYWWSSINYTLMKDNMAMYIKITTLVHG